MDDLTPGQEEAVAATVGAIQRIAMAIVELPTEGREAHYAMVRRKFEAALIEVGIEGAAAHAWLNSTMNGIESLVSEIEAGGGASGGRLRRRAPRHDLDRIPLRAMSGTRPRKKMIFEPPERNLDARILGAHHIQIAPGSHDG